MQAPDRLPIVAIATAAGRGGVGIVRLSFGNTPRAAALALIRELLGQDPDQNLTPRHATYLPFPDADGQIIDRGIALWFPGPHSYTGEDVLELQGHGGPVVLQLLLRRCLQAGAAIGLRLAEPGEFTERAFLNDKLDLAQAEAVADLIEASTEAAARSASRSLEGAFSGAIRTLVDQVIQLRMLVEATLDFPEEEIDFLEASNARGQLAAIRAQLAVVQSQARQGALLREGLNVVLAGAPNVGKSSLLNALAGAELAIVTPIAGTTRDRVQQAIQIEGIPLNIIDTAGLRETDDEVERIGIARSWEAIAAADVVLHLSDAARASAAADAGGNIRSGDDATAHAPEKTNPDTEASVVAADLGAEISARLPHGVPVLEVRNKIDLSGEVPHVATVDGRACVWLSARQKSGIDLLRGELLKIAGWQSGNDSVYLARERHLVALRAAGTHLDAAAGHAAQQAQALDLFAEELRLAQDRLNEITGEFTPDDLLGVIFSRFCIGK